MWVALRSPAGELEPLEDLTASDLPLWRILAALQGVSLRDYLLLALRTLAADDERQQPGRTAEALMGQWIEVPADAALWDLLRRRRFLGGALDTLGEVAALLLHPISYAAPGAVGHVALWAAEGIAPAEGIRRLNERFMQAGELPFDCMANSKHCADNHFERSLRRGVYDALMDAAPLEITTNTAP